MYNQPCPECKSKHLYYLEDKNKKFAVSCSPCGVTGRKADSKKEALEKWNG